MWKPIALSRRDRGEVVCDDCGLVLEDNVIDQGAEWRVFSPNKATSALVPVHP